MPVDKIEPLLPNTGFDVEGLAVESSDENAAEKIVGLFGRTREAIDAGHPVMGWSLEHIDWYPVCGYDEEGNYVYHRGNGKIGAYPHAELGKKAPGELALLSIVRPGTAPDNAAVVREALAFAAKMGRGEFSHELYTSGIGAYDVWIKAMEPDEGEPNPGTSFGHAFNAACWSDCRKQAVEFLEEAKARLNDDSLAPHFDKAIEKYGVVANQLKTLGELYPCQPGNHKAMQERFGDSDLRKKAVAALNAARDAEEAGLKALAEIEQALE
jgi:hypothetical protein